MNALLNTLLEITVYSAVLFGAVLLFQRVFKKRISAGLNYAVWALLILRLVLPVTVDSGLHLFTVPEARTADTVADTARVSDTPVEAQTGRLLPFTREKADTSASTKAIPAADKTGAAALGKQDKPWMPDWPSALTLLWAAGILASLIHTGALWLGLKKKIGQSGSPAPGTIQALADACAAELGVRAKIPVISVGFLETPALSSSLKPKILLPERLMQTLDRERLSYCLRHELTHYQRKDHYISLLLMLLRCAHWFNPFVHLAFRRIQTDMEIACDAGAASGLDRPSRLVYIQTMIDLAGKANAQYVLGMGGRKGKKAMEKRVRGVFMREKTGFPARVAAAAVAALLVVTCFTTACRPTPAEPAVANKNQNRMENAISAAPLPIPSPAQAGPAKGAFEMITSSHWKDSVSNKYTTVTVDADILMPDVSAYPVTEVQPVVVDEAFAKRIVDYFTKDAVKVYNGSYESKSVYESTILRFQKNLEEVKNGILPPDDDRPAKEQIEELEGIIKSCKEDYAAYLSEGDPSSKPLNYAFKKDRARPDLKDALVINAEMKDGTLLQFDFDRFEESGLQYSQLSFGDKYAGRDKGSGQLIPMGKAAGMAEELFSGLNIGGFGLFDDYIDDRNGIVFAKSYNGIPVNVVYAGGGPSVTESGAYNFVLGQEKIGVMIDDAGIAQISWETPCKAVRTVNGNVALLSTDKIKNIFRKQILYRFAENTTSKELVTINDVRLGYMVIPVKGDLTRLQTIPVWDFIGPFTSDPEEIKEAADRGRDFTDPRSYLTLNAIDGSVIDRGLGY
jgi:beta-lactamase regulating signal transducer with metallopeptidase domain